MRFDSPLWLWGLIGWAAIAIWILRGRRVGIIVPFLPLWPESHPQNRRQRSWQLPPPALALLVGAIFLAILAAARPVYLHHDPNTDITIIADRGLTMSTQTREGERRLTLAAGTAQAWIEKYFPKRPIHLQWVPAGPVGADAGPYSNDQWLAKIRDSTPTAVDPSEAVNLAVAAALRSSQGPVFVLSDCILAKADPRIVQIAPVRLPDNVSIDSLVVRGDPEPQAMVRISNFSDSALASLTISSDDKSFPQQIKLPPPGSSGNYFVKIAPGQVVEAQVLELDASGGAVPGRSSNQIAWSVRTPSWPKMTGDSDLPPDVRKMIDVYTKLRPATPDGHAVVVSDSAHFTSIQSAAARIAAVGPDDRQLDSTKLPVINEDLFSTSDVDWRKVLQNATAVPPPGTDWKAVVEVGGVTAVAARLTPVRQVWVGFYAPDFSKTPDFVVFWSEVFNWLGESGPEYRSEQVGALTGDWVLERPSGQTISANEMGLLPGLYRRADGTELAVNAGPQLVDLSPAQAEPVALSDLSAARGSASVNLSAVVFVLAVLLACYAMLLLQSSEQKLRWG